MTDVLKLVSNTADGVFAINSECRFILWNKAAQEILGFSPEEVLGKFCYEILPGNDQAGNPFCFQGCSVVAMAKKGCLAKNYDIQMTTKAGHEVWLNVSILLVPRPRQKAPVIIHQFRPVSGEGVLKFRGKGYSAGGEGLIEQVASKVLEILKVRGHAPGANQISSVTKTSLLTPRETEILGLMAQCLGTKEIADRLCISYSTVRLHVQHILEKLQVHSKVEAVAMAFQQNLIPNLSDK